MALQVIISTLTLNVDDQAIREGEENTNEYMHD